MELNKDVDWEKVKEIFTPEKEDYFKKIKKKLDKYPAAEETLRTLAAVGAISLGMLLPGPAMFIVKEI